MRRIGIVGDKSNLFISAAREHLPAGKQVLETVRESGAYDAILILPEADLAGLGTVCRILIVPEKTSLNDLRAKTVVSYGMSQRNTVTLSSTEEKHHIVALQRDVMSLGGTLVLRQEFNLTCDLQPYETLALASLLIVTGVLEQ